MNDASNIWRLTLDGREHEIVADYTMMLGRIEILVDGASVLRERILISRTALEFPVGARSAQVIVDYSYGGLLTRSTLVVDGSPVDPLPR